MTRIEVKGVMELDGSGWERTINRAQSQVQNFTGEGLGELKSAIASAFSIGAIEEFVRREIEAVSRIKELSEQAGISTDQVQKLDRAAQHVGLAFENVNAALSKFGAARKRAGEHEGDMLRELSRWGVTLEDIRNPALSNLDILQKMSVAMENLAQTAQGREELREFFGKGGDKLAAVLHEAATMKPITLIAPEQIEAIDRFNKSLTDVKLNLEAIASGPLAMIASSVNNMSGSFQKKLLGLTQYLALPTTLPAQAVMKLMGIPDPFAAAEKLTQPSAGGSPANKGTAQSSIFNLKENKDLWDQLHKAESENKQAGLTREQQILELKKQQLEIEERMKSERGDSLLKDEILLVQTDTKLKELQTHGHPQHLNEHLRTGNFLGANGTAVSTIGERLVKGQHEGNGYLRNIMMHLTGNNGQVNTNGSTGVPYP